MASDIKKFLAKESEPGKLLKSLTWELTDQCATADAVIRVYFAQTTRLTEMRDRPGDCHPAVALDVPATQVVLLVYDRASVRLLYRTEVQRHSDRTDVLLLKVTFARLARDLRRTRGLTVLPALPGCDCLRTVRIRMWTGANGPDRHQKSGL